MKLSSNEGAFGPLPAAVAAYEAAARELNRYPDGGGRAAARGAGRAPRRARGPGGARQRRRRADPPLRRGHAGAGRRGGVPVALVPELRHRRRVQRRPTPCGCRSRSAPPTSVRCSSGRARRARGSCTWPTRTTPPGRRGGERCARASWTRSPRTCCACWTRPTPSTPTPSPRAPPSCARAARACACCAPSRRSTGWRRCASVTPWPRPRWRTRSTGCARSST